MFRNGVWKLFPVPYKLPFVAASYQLIGSAAVAVSVIDPGPQLDALVVVGAVDTALIAACTEIRFVQLPT